MNSIATALIVAACVFTAGVGGMFLHRVLPEAHLAKETQDAVKLATGMLSVLASLVLGLLVATAKSAYDTTDHDIRGYAAELILLNETLRDYGDAAAPPRAVLRRYAEVLLREYWPDEAPAIAEPESAGALMEHVREAIRALKPADDGQRWLMEQALQINISLLRQRWLLIEQQGPSVRPSVLAILVSWIAVIFVTFGINAPRNATVLVAFLASSLAIGGSVLLILGMDSPLAGWLRISSWPVTNALEYMAK